MQTIVTYMHINQARQWFPLVATHSSRTRASQVVFRMCQIHTIWKILFATGFHGMRHTIEDAQANDREALAGGRLNRVHLPSRGVVHKDAVQHACVRRRVLSMLKTVPRKTLVGGEFIACISPPACGPCPTTSGWPPPSSESLLH